MDNNLNLTGIQWRKSSYSGDQGGNCVEVASAPHATIAIRDSKTPTGPVLSFRPGVFADFVTWTSTTAE